jgi:hypothetical protein
MVVSLTDGALRLVDGAVGTPGQIRGGQVKRRLLIQTLPLAKRVLVARQNPAVSLRNRASNERPDGIPEAENPRHEAWGSKLPRMGISDAAAGCRGDGDHRVAVNDCQCTGKTPNLHCTFGRTRYLHDDSFDTFV